MPVGKGKKRGRKPKNNIIVNSKPIKTIHKEKDNLIVCIKVKKNNLSNKNEILPGYMEENYELNTTEINDINCWNCCHKLSQSYTSIPIKYMNKVFYIYGNFCDLSCGFRYILDTFDNKELWSKYELFQFYNKKIYGKNVDIIPAPDRLSLKIFGGNLSYEEYKNGNIQYNIVNIPPIVPINNISAKLENDKINENNGELKLFRKKNIKKENILNNLNV